MLIKVCLNGAHGPEAHLALPLTPAALAAEARAAVAAGAGAVHMHPRDAEGVQSLAARDIGAAVAAVRNVYPVSLTRRSGERSCHMQPIRAFVSITR
jgi:uncharacterized protein (DUF849 family)